MQFRFCAGIICFLAFSVIDGYSQSVTYLGMDQGLSNSTVTSIFKDSYGFMWFGTFDGLNRYDGYTFTKYRNLIGDSTSLPDNYVNAILEAKDKKLYVGTKKGIGILNYKTFKFSGLKYRPLANPKKSFPIDKYVNAIQEDGRGNIYIITANLGLLVLKKGETVARQIKQSSGISAVCVGIGPNVWFECSQEGLCLYNSQTGAISNYAPNLKNANCIKYDLAGNLWLGTNAGLFRIDKGTASCKPYELPGLNLSSSRIMDIEFEKGRYLWISTDGDGLPVIDIQSNKVVQTFKHNEDKLLTSNSLYTVYIDKDGRKWIGTMRGGINILDSHKNIFKTIRHEPYNPNSLIHNTVLSFCEDGENIWIGTDGGGISLWNRNKNLFKPYVFKNQPGANQITSIIRDQNGNIWAATYGAGVKRFNKATQDFENVPFLQRDNGAKYVFKLFRDSENNIWAGCIKGRYAGNLEKGLFKFDRASNRFVPAPFPINAEVISIAEDKSGNLWLGTISNALQVNKKSGKVKLFDLDTYVRAVYVDKEENVWMGAYGRGLVVYNAKLNELKTFNETNGLANNTVVNIEEDANGFIWLATFNGLSRLNPKTLKFENFYAADGLQANQFYYNSSAKLSTGELLFGGINGFNIFNPKDIKAYKGFPQIVITGMSVLNNPVSADSEFLDNASSIYDIKHIELPYEKSMFSLNFVALEYSLPDKIKYAYHLKGWDKAWNYTNNLRTVSYSRLNEGKYTLEIRSTNASGIWNNSSKLIEVTVLPPWYRSWWAYCLYIAMGASAIYGYVYYQKEKARLKFEVELTSLKAAQEAELNEKRISFFTNIAHELRTPLTLIVNPVKDLLNNDGKNINLVDVSAVHRNTRRLLSLVDQLLLFKSAENEVSNLKPEVLGLGEVCNEVFLCFINQVKAKGIEYTFDNQVHDLKIFGDREKIEIVLFNLLSNAIKYGGEQGTVILTLKQDGVNALMSVKNTGPVIPAEIGEKLFEKFFRLGQNQAPTKKSGFGIGLFISKQISEIQGGKLSYSSTSEKGTIFEYRLPLNTENIDITTSKGTNPSNTNLLEELYAGPTDNEINSKETVSESMNRVYEGVVEQKPNVLLVDDDAEIRAYVRQILQPSYNVFESESAERASELLKKVEPDIIVSDIVMEGMSGVELCAKIKESKEFSHIPVILLTGTSSPEVKLKGIECGADDYITKPFEKDLLIARIRSILKGRDSLKRYFFNEVTLQSNNEKVSEEYSAFLKKCIDIVDKHLQDEQFNVKVFVKEMGMSHSNVFRKVKAISGLSISEFIRYIRLKKAAELMIQTDIQVKEVAYNVGIQDARYFREQFSKIFGLNPSDYIKKYRRTFLRAPGS